MVPWYVHIDVHIDHWYVPDGTRTTVPYGTPVSGTLVVRTMVDYLLVLRVHVVDYHLVHLYHGIE
jgi:hypothetical protein